MNVLLIKTFIPRNIISSRSEDKDVRIYRKLSNYIFRVKIIVSPHCHSSLTVVVTSQTRYPMSILAHALPRALCCKWGLVDKGRRESLPSTRVPNRGLTRGRRRGAGRRIEIPRKKIFVPWNWTWDALIRPDRACIDVFNTHVTGGHSV